MAEEEQIEEITVTAERPKEFGGISSGGFGPLGISGPGRLLSGSGSGGLAFVPPAAPAAVTEIIEEIVVKAKRPPKIPLGTFGGIVTGIAALGAAVAREVSQQRLEESFRAFESVQPRVPDSPVETIPAVQPIEEIIVTARRPVRTPQTFTFISPDADPFTMIPIAPRFLPSAPTAVPDVVVSPPTIPAVRPTPVDIPLPIPQRIPRFTPLPIGIPGATPAPFADPLPAPVPVPGPVPGPDVLPQPFPLPGPMPDVLPQPFPQPAPSPRPGPLSFVGPGTVGLPTGFSFPSPFAAPFARPQAQPQRPRPRRCPPCKKQKRKKEKARTQCFKKLVKEGRFKKDDRSFNWAPIDCRTGKEL